MMVVMAVMIVMVMMVIVVMFWSTGFLEGFFKFSVHRGHEFNGAMNVFGQ